MSHPRIVILLEGDEESGSEHLPFYLDKLEKDVGVPDLIICLDSGALDYNRLWVTTSLRGSLSNNHIIIWKYFIIYLF